MFREEVTSALVGFHMGPLSWWNWNLEMLVFVKRGKSENPEKTLRSRREPTQTNPKYGSGTESNPGHNDGRRTP